LALLIVVGAAVGGATFTDRFERAVKPEFAGFGDARTAKLQLWITPPAYTGLAPLFPKALPSSPDNDAAEAAPPPLKAPAGSVLSAQVSGGRGTAELIIDEKRIAFDRIDDRNSKLTHALAAGGTVEIRQNGDRLGAWSIEIVADQPPVVAFSAPPAATARNALRMAFRASDDYGLDKVAAEIRRTYEGGEVTGKELVELALNLPGLNVRKADEIAFQDLTPHHWAGLPVVMRLRATDGAGQTSYSKDARLVLPEREFRHPVAQAIIGQRKRLTTEPERRRSIVQALREIAARPGAFDHRVATFLALITSSARLISEPEKTAIPPVREVLWDTALGVEDGRLSIFERNLRQAQRDLMKAMSENASDHELQRLLNEFERALNQFLRAMAQQMRNRPQDEQFLPVDPRTRMLESTDIQRMLKQIRDLLRAGERRAAREMLAQLRNLLENLRAGRMRAGNQRSRAANQAVSRLQDLIRRQSKLLERTFRRSQGRMTRPGAEASGKDARSQRALRQTLKQLRDMLARMGIDMKNGKGPGKAFGLADQAMGESAGALDSNLPGEAVGPQGRALDALQQLGRGMMQQMRNQFARGSGLGMQPRFNPLRQRRDPLGRYMPGDDGFDSSDVEIPDQGTVERAQCILDELRRRAGQRFRPRFELEYIDRLLQRF